MVDGSEALQSAEETGRAVMDAAEDLPGQVVEAMNDMALEERAAAAAEAAGDAAGHAAEAAECAAEAAGEAADTVGETAVAVYNSEEVQGAMDGAGEAASAAAEGVQDAGVAAAAGASAAAAAAAKAAQEAANSEEAQAAAAAAAQAAEAAMDGMKAAAAGASNALYAVPEFDMRGFSETVKSGAGQTFEQVVDVIESVQWGETLATGLEKAGEYAEEAGLVAVAVGGVCIACFGDLIKEFPVIKLEIFRDFYQILGSFFTNLGLSEALEGAKSFFGNLSTIIALDWTFVFPTIPVGAILAALFAISALCIIGTITLFCITWGKTPDAIRQGHETVHWTHRSKWFRRGVWLMLNILMSVYMPISTGALKVLTCHPQYVISLEEFIGNSASLCSLTCTEEMPDELCAPLDPCLPEQSAEECAKGSRPKGSPPLYVNGYDGYWDCAGCTSLQWHGIIVAFSVITLLLVTLGLPVYCYFLIQKNKPVGTKEDPNSCFDEDGNKVEYTAAMYQKDLKSAKYQASPYMFLMTGYERRFAFYKVLVMVVKLCLAVMLVIFIKNQLIGAAACLGINLVYSAISFASRPFIDMSADYMDICARVTGTLTIALALISMPGIVDAETVFSALTIALNALNLLCMVVLVLYSIPWVQNKYKELAAKFDLDDTCADYVSSDAEKVVANWNLALELRHRVWHAFWVRIVRGTELSDEIRTRFDELVEVARQTGMEKIQAHFRNGRDPRQIEVRAHCTTQLEGVDVFWDGRTHDGVNDSQSNFGKCYFETYPFHAVFVADDSDDYVFLHNADELDLLVRKNTDPAIAACIHNRRVLRSLNGCLVNWPHTRMESHTVDDGTRTVTDKDGNTSTEQLTSTVQVEMHYTNGTVSSPGTDVKPGFGCSMTFRDGHGQATKPRTGEVASFSNVQCTLGATQFGLVPSCEMTPGLDRLINGNVQVWQTKLPEVTRFYESYRADLNEERDAKERILASSFWLYVYANDGASRQELESYLLQFEHNPEVREIPIKHKLSVDLLYMRLDYARTDQRIMLWMVFWSSFWSCNRKMKQLQTERARDLFDPSRKTCIAYHPIPREKLEHLIADAKLRKPKALFSDAMMDSLYGALDRVGSKTEEA